MRLRWPRRTQFRNGKGSHLVEYAAPEYDGKMVLLKALENDLAGKQGSPRGSPRKSGGFRRVQKPGLF